MFKRIHWSRYFLFSILAAVLYCVVIYFFLTDTTYSRVISCLLCFALVVRMVPGLFDSGPPQKVLEGAPANTVHDKTRGFLYMIFGGAIIGNAAAGFFISIIFPFALKGDQTKERVDSKQSEL